MSFAAQHATALVEDQHFAEVRPEIAKQLLVKLGKAQPCRFRRGTHTNKYTYTPDIYIYIYVQAKCVCVCVRVRVVMYIECIWFMYVLWP